MLVFSEVFCGLILMQLEMHVLSQALYEPRCEKTGLRGFRPGPTQIGLCSHRRLLEHWNFEFKTKRDCTIRVAKTKVLL